MTLTDLALRHRLTVYVPILFVLFSGAGAYLSLPRESFPEVEIPLILVYTGYLGASPEDVETLLTRPIETELKGITGVKEIRSSSSDGLSVIEGEFNPDVDLESALQRVREQVEFAKAELPLDIDDEPRVQDIDFSQIPVLVVSLAGEVGLVQLKEIAELLKDDIKAISGVNRVTVVGGREREVHLHVDPLRLSAYELGLSDVIAAVQRENLTVPGGNMDIGSLSYLVRITAEISEPRELESSCAGAGVAFALQGAIWLVWSVVRRIGGWQPWVTDRRAAVLWGMGVILIGTAAAYGVWGQGLEFFPETSPRQVWIDLEVPSGTNLDTADAIVRQVEMITAETPDLRDLSASVGSTGISLNSPQPTGVVASVSRVTLDLLDNRDRSQDSLLTLEQVRSRIAGVTGAEVTVDKPEDGPPTAKPIVVRIIGDDFGALGELSRTVQDTIRVVPGLVNLTDDYDQGKPEIRVRVNRVQAAVAGVNTREITGAIQTAIRGAETSTYRIGEDEYDIRVRLAPETRSLDALKNLTVSDEDGLQIPLRTIVELESGVGPGAVRRVDLRRVVTLEGDVVRTAGRTEDSVRADVAALLDEMSFPPGYRWEFAGANQDQLEAQMFLQQAFVTAVILITLVLVTQFNNLVLPLTVMISVVLSLIGVLWGLIITDTPFGLIMTGVGVISLAGIVVNNAIVLGDCIQQLRSRGVEKTEAIVRAGVLRFRPVLLTAVTTVLGLLPLTIGLNIDFFNLTVEYGAESSQWWGAMGVAVIAGLTVATVLTLVIVPVTYHTLDEFTGLAAALPARFRAERRVQRSHSAPTAGSPSPAEP